jgi:hypothetical protein
MSLKKFLNVVTNKLRIPTVTEEMELVLAAGAAALESTTPSTNFDSVRSIANSKVFTDRQSDYLSNKLADMRQEARRKALVAEVSRFLVGAGDLNNARYTIDELYGENYADYTKRMNASTPAQASQAKNSMLSQMSAYNSYTGMQNLKNQGIQNTPQELLDMFQKV